MRGSASSIAHDWAIALTLLTRLRGAPLLFKGKSGAGSAHARRDEATTLMPSRFMAWHGTPDAILRLAQPNGASLEAVFCRDRNTVTTPRPRRRSLKPGDDPERTTFGLNLLAARLAQNRTQRDVAKAAGTTHQYVSLVECGHASPTWNSMTKLAKAVGCEVANLLTEPPQ